VLLLSELVTGSLRELMTEWLGAQGCQGPIFYEPFAYESLRRGNQVVFGFDGIPSYRIDHSDFLISFGADFLETWLSPVEYARQFAAFRELGESGKKPFVYVGPRLSLTAANADLWIPVHPDEEYVVALGLIRVLLEEGLSSELMPHREEALRSTIKDWTLDVVSERTGVSESELRALARRFARAKRPLALTGGVTSSGPSGTEAVVADSARAEDIRALSERMREGEIDLLIFHNTNPIFSLPYALGFSDALRAVPFVVSFSNTMDETTERADLILPVHSPLESWGDYSPRRGVENLMQPVMGPVFDTKHLGDILLLTGKQLDAERFPWKDFYEMLRASWERKRHHASSASSFQSFWQSSVRRGGLWESSLKPEYDSTPIDIPEFLFTSPRSVKSKGGFHFTVYPTIQFFDGRGANRPWLQELPDPLTQTTWGGWVEIHPDTARKMDVQRGDVLRLRSPFGTLEVPANPYGGILPDTLAVPIGQGHAAYGRYARGNPGNPMALLSADHDAASGGALWTTSGVSIEKTGEKTATAHTDGSLYQMGRGLARSISFERYHEATRTGDKPHLSLPLPEGYDPEKDFYPPHDHVNYRWGMAVDLDRCIGCGACVVACYAENNLSIVGRELILQGREMSWIRIQRYFEPDATGVRFLRMLCQHCDNAPCESVCPVYAPHHSVEGLNNQVYNRCIGTRFCSQNCPYKVRRFNWFTFTRAEPLNWQLNPDITVRQKGVMEKCSFCVQRIVEAKNRARNKGRMVQDGEVTPACVQTCPTDALTFGNLLDSTSRLSKLIKDVRAYQVFEHLNTKPAVIYLKRVARHIEKV
jgi:molybdopterin-containing oxidoreductase family iron-sulfur binding subunit